jgi:general secretion pathway protein G
MGRSTVIGKSSRFETRNREFVFRGWPWGPGGACRPASLEFQISDFEFQRQRESKLGLEPSPVHPLRISNLKFQISNSELPASGSKFPIAGFELPVSHSNTWGFTLIELMVVLTLLLILATMSMPIFQLAIVHAREAVLKDDLYTLRKLIDEFTLDKQRPPTTLDDLVDAGYLRGGIPVDPFTGSNQTWRTDVEDVPLNPSQAASGIVDVHSGSDETALDGTPYSSW